jgi:hypothetical protein
MTDTIAVIVGGGNPYFDGPVWYWFSLSYSSYLVLPRALMCGMPIGWQLRMVELLEEAEQVYRWEDMEQDYTVHLRSAGRFKRDPLANYRHPPQLPYRNEASHDQS